MKIAMIYPDYSSEKGISKYSSELVTNIRKQGMEVEDINFIQGKPLSLFKHIHKLLDYDVIHIQHEYNMLGWYGLPYFFFLGFLGLFKKRGSIVTMHTVLSQKENFKSGKLKTFLRKILYKIQNRWISWTSAKIIVHAKSFKKILTEEYNIPSKKIIVLPHAIIEDIKTVSKVQARKELNLDGNVYLLIGTMIPDHGHDIITKQSSDIGKTILVVTNPSAVNDRNESKITNFLELNKKIVRDNNFEKLVRFDLGFIPYEKWWKYFSAADLILLPYRGGIGSGIFADAMAMKKPVIASGKYFKGFTKDYGCIKIAKQDKDFPVLIKDAMKIKNYKKMIKECERYFSENGLTSVSKKYKKLYTSLSK
ncbi:glycosyltransferase [archaeon]|nr:glycosyltransferase [archaeon]MBT7128942.1 glycosyltransferase [archaeon]